MTNWTSFLRFEAELWAWKTRLDGQIIPLGRVSHSLKIMQPLEFWRRMWVLLRSQGLLAGVGLGAFVAAMHWHNYGFYLPMLGLVTDAGIDFMAGDFGGGTNAVSNLKYQESGVGSTAESILDTDLVSKIPLARVAGTNTKPATKEFLSSAAIVYNSTYSIAEWGLFSVAGSGSPPAGGTLWDRRLVAPTAGVLSGETITFQYYCAGNSGGS